MEHGRAVTWICRYLADTRDRGVTFHLDRGKLFDVYADADFAGLWNKAEAEDPATAKSRTGYVITFAGCPLLWASKLQSIVALSSTESELIAASDALRASINLTDIAKEAQDHGVSIGGTCPNFHTRLFEDNTGAIELICTNKLCPRTKHINIKIPSLQTAC